jgi:hypothetical protein
VTLYEIPLNASLPVGEEVKLVGMIPYKPLSARTGGGFDIFADVGLGKTIEAGLIITELLAGHGTIR